MLAADVANQYVDRMKPWALAKNRENDAELHEICSVALNMFRILTVYLKPVLPKLAEKAERVSGRESSHLERCQFAKQTVARRITKLTIMST